MNKMALAYGRLLLLGISLCVAARPSAAQPAGQKARPASPIDALIGQATAAMTAQDFPAAQRFLGQAFGLLPGGVVLYHLGLLAAAEQHAVEARDLLRRFLADPTIDANHPLRAEAQKKFDSLPVLDAGEVSIGAPRGTQVQL